MASTGHNHGLWRASIEVKVAYLLTEFKAIHDRHADVGQYQAVEVWPSDQTVSHFLHGLEAIVGAIYGILKPLDTHLLQDDLHA